ncbi:hypothetical protein GCM10009119_35440 [Algoriphagus jejuensis]|uniref:Uncharacterized protein n=1 Tax=Algoriphagus jejuensis TaxID=419934 RepID=A0ABP3YI19_9BACT
MFTENFFTKLLDLEDGWIVESVDSNLTKEEIYIQVACVLDQLEDAVTGELCKIYDYAPERSWRHLDTMQYKTYIKVGYLVSRRQTERSRPSSPIGLLAMSATRSCLSMRQSIC